MVKKVYLSFSHPHSQNLIIAETNFDVLDLNYYMPNTNDPFQMTAKRVLFALSSLAQNKGFAEGVSLSTIWGITSYPILPELLKMGYFRSAYEGLLYTENIGN